MKNDAGGTKSILSAIPCTYYARPGLCDHQDDHRGYDKTENDQCLGYGLKDDDGSYGLGPFGDRSRPCCTNPGLRPSGAYGTTGKCNSSSYRNFPTNHVDTSSQ